MTHEEALGLRYGTMIYHRTRRQGRGTEPLRVRVTGKVRTWKRDPERIEIPVKWGMYQSGTIVARELPDWFLSEAKALSANDKSRRRLQQARSMVSAHGLCERAGRCVDHEEIPVVSPCRCRCGAVFATNGRVLFPHDFVAEHMANCEGQGY